MTVINHSQSMRLRLQHYKLTEMSRIFFLFYVSLENIYSIFNRYLPWEIFTLRFFGGRDMSENQDEMQIS